MSRPEQVTRLEPTNVVSYRALACELRHCFLSEHRDCSVVAVDGAPGSERTFFAERLAKELGAVVVHTRDFMPGWNGLGASLDLLEEWVLGPLARGDQASWRRFDWDSMRSAESVVVPRSKVLVVEGRGVGKDVLLRYLSYVVWVNSSAPRHDALTGGIDEGRYEPFAEASAAQEKLLRAGDDVASRADLVVESAVASSAHDVNAVFLRGAVTASSVGAASARRANAS